MSSWPTSAQEQDALPVICGSSEWQLPPEVKTFGDLRRVGLAAVPPGRLPTLSFNGTAVVLGLVSIRR